MQRKWFFSDYIQLNFLPSCCKIPEAQVIQLDWNEIDSSPSRIQLEHSSFDIIIGTDVVYEGTNASQLAKVVLKYLSVSPNSCALFVFVRMQSNFWTKWGRRR
jgi:predicted nicotinamide N-methyase